MRLDHPARTITGWTRVATVAAGRILIAWAFGHPIVGFAQTPCAQWDVSSIGIQQSNAVGILAFRPGAGGGTQPDIPHSNLSVR